MGDLRSTEVRGQRPAHNFDLTRHSGGGRDPSTLSPSTYQQLPNLHSEVWHGHRASRVFFNSLPDLAGPV